MNLQITHKNFINKLRADGKSESTIIAYNKDIEQLVSHVENLKITESENLKAEHVESFMGSLAEKGYTAKSISRKTNAARTFVKYMFDEKAIETDFSNALKHPKFETKAPRILSRLEYRALRDAARNDDRTFAMIEVLLQAGVTISELAGIKLENVTIDGDKGTLFIPKRNNRDARNIPLNKAVVEAINNYTENARYNIEGADSLFITKTGRALLVRNIRSTINRFFKLAGVENAKVNDLRHTFVAHHLENGVNISYLSKVAGHKRISTTEKYLEYVKVEGKSNKSELGIL